MNILAYLLAAPLTRGPYQDLGSVYRMLAKCPFNGTVERAIWGGFHADRLGYAFVGGYGAALSKLVSTAEKLERPLPARVCLCATEAGGGHPRSIASRLDKQGGALVLNGEKTFATLATLAEELLVVASRGVEADGKARLRVVRVRPNAPGVTMRNREETPFAPELPHAIVTFQNVVVENEDVLPGDGYEAYLKPFRTIEDTHVIAATVGYLAGVGRTYGFSRDAIAECVSTSLALVDVSARDASKAMTHIVLAGILASVRRLVGSLGDEWSKVDSEERARWQRDLPLLMVAEVVRNKRTERAFENAANPSAVPSSGGTASSGRLRTP